MNVVWNALTQSDVLVKLKDLNYIKDMRTVHEAVESFRKIMVKETNYDGEVKANPLLKETSMMQDYHQITPEQRIFAQLQAAIEKGLVDL